MPTRSFPRSAPMPISALERGSPEASRRCSTGSGSATATTTRCRGRSRVSVIFVINHRSNMDYVLVTYVAATSSALSYAVGEWAQVWGLRGLIRSMGAYFISRDSRDALYRKCWRAMSTWQRRRASFRRFSGRRPEPRRRAARAEVRAVQLHGLGLRSARPARRGVHSRSGSITIACWRTACSPRGQYRAGQEAGVRVQRGGSSRSHFFRHLWMAMRGEWYRFGYTCVSFGEPVSLRKHVAEANTTFARLRPKPAMPRLKSSGTG